ncbi:NAD-dependent deacetylase [Candidatus Uabimicrobium sp. HlEnr_7]|uniref:SIR2 family NAD-dependent protein deacylase n=1 Tax=Candidatus Uabimicrobium helgolandensis TaxID=3095367 RepID=UPI003557AB85
MEEKLQQILNEFKENEGNLTILTGAGISVESGIPTFRGADGYWTVGSVNYQFQQIGTFTFFEDKPLESWKWFLYRKGVCGRSKPNLGHMAVVDFEKHLQDRFRLITQNVDGLHLLAGNSEEKTFQVHGNINQMRCSKECSYDIYDIPDKVQVPDRNASLTDEMIKLLCCPKCKAMTRPHVLWWDESYNEHHFRIHSTRAWVDQTDLLITVGTSASANVACTTVYQVKDNGGSLIDINPAYSPLGDIAKHSHSGTQCTGTSSEYLPIIRDFLLS